MEVANTFHLTASSNLRVAISKCAEIEKLSVVIIVVKMVRQVDNYAEFIKANSESMFRLSSFYEKSW